MSAATRIGLWLGIAVVVAGAALAVVVLRAGEAPAGKTSGLVDARKAADGAGSAGGAGGDRANAGPPRAGVGINKPPGLAGTPDMPASTAGGSATEADRMEATKLLETARAEATSGRYNEALDVFHRAHEMAPDPSTLLEIGRMEHLTGRCREARHTTRRVIDDSSDAALIDKAQRLLDEIGRCD